jgi:SAM-dependent methyltransferase
MSETDYVLGTHDEEIARLGLQHRVWLTQAAAAWQRAGFSEGQTVVDLGSGPGYASIELARLVGPSGRVIAIERSRRFLDHLEAERARLGLHHIELVEADLDKPLQLDVDADGLWCRWVAAFVRNPQQLVAGLRRLLKPGGAAVFHEYGEYRTWRLLPDSPELNEFVEAVITSWRADGGEPDIGRSLPAWLQSAGFRIEHVTPIVEVLTPQDEMWQWPRAFVKNGTERLVALGALQPARAQRIRDAFDEAERTPGTRLMTPLVLEVIARRT